MKQVHIQKQTGLKLLLLAALALNISWVQIFEAKHESARIDMASETRPAPNRGTQPTRAEESRPAAATEAKPPAASEATAPETVPVEEKTERKQTNSDTTAAKPTVSSSEYQSNFCNVSHQVILQEVKEHGKTRTEVRIRKSTEACSDCYVMKQSYENQSLQQLVDQKQQLDDAILAVLKPVYRDQCTNQEQQTQEEPEDFTASYENCETDKKGNSLDKDQKVSCALERLADIGRPKRDPKTGRLVRTDNRETLAKMKKLVNSILRPGIKRLIKEDLEDGLAMADEALEAMEGLGESLDYKNEREERSMKREIARMTKDIVSVKDYGVLHHGHAEKKTGIDEMTKEYAEAYMALQNNDPRAFAAIHGLNMEHQSMSSSLNWLDWYRRNSSIPTSESNEFVQMYQQMTQQMTDMLDMQKIISLNPANENSGLLLPSNGAPMRNSTSNGLGRAYGFSTPLLPPSLNLNWQGFNYNPPVSAFSTQTSNLNTTPLSSAMGRATRQ